MILISIIQSILTNILKAIYEPFGFALLLAVFFMFFYLFAKATSWTKAVKIWWEMFRKSKRFRHLFLLSFYVALMLFRTLLNRSIWSNPLSNILGGWGLYGDDGEMTTEAIENIALFLPFTALLYWTFPEKICGSQKYGADDRKSSGDQLYCFTWNREPSASVLSWDVSVIRSLLQLDWRNGGRFGVSGVSKRIQSVEKKTVRGE
ncbi:hypothetical protein AXF09_11490 [Ruminococcus sp. DSM 100440]|nr:hypothetical protein AXF09_11490 [Ruminococcus sp. DSM 100440]